VTRRTAGVMELAGPARRFQLVNAYFRISSAHQKMSKTFAISARGTIIEALMPRTLVTSVERNVSPAPINAAPIPTIGPLSLSAPRLSPSASTAETTAANKPAKPTNLPSGADRLGCVGSRLDGSPGRPDKSSDLPEGLGLTWRTRLR
jgi:hypothetical protein